MSGAPARPALLLALDVPHEFRARLASLYEVVGPHERRLAELVAAMSRQEAERIAVILMYGNTKVTRATIDALPALGLVCCVGSGFEGVDLDAATARGIAVAHSPGANASAVADLAIGLMIASVRRIVVADTFVRAAQWSRGHRMPEVRGLTGRKVGIYGLGAIGTKIARRCEALEMEVAYHGRAPHAGVRYPFHASLVDLATWADVLMIAVRAGPDNEYAVNLDVLRALGSEGHVVNVTRGSMIDEGALHLALTNGMIAGAALDVFEHEPIVPGEFRMMDNIVLSPHMGGAVHEAQDAMREAAWRNVEAFATRGAVVHPVLAR